MAGLFAKWGGGEVLRKAVSGMLPKNRLRKVRLARLRSMYKVLPIRRRCSHVLLAFEGEAHPYKANIIQFKTEQSKIITAATTNQNTANLT